MRNVWKTVDMLGGAKDLSKELGVCRATVYHWIRDYYTDPKTSNFIPKSPMIPAKYHQRIIAFGETMGLTLTPNDMVN